MRGLRSIKTGRMLRATAEQVSPMDCPQHKLISLVGNIAPRIELALQSVVTRQIRLQGSCASAGEIPACIDLLAAGLIQVEPMLSAFVPIDEGPQWFERLYNHEAGLMKVVLHP